MRKAINKMNLLSWTALGSLGMTIMFVALILSFYNFLIGPGGKGPQQVTDPFGVLAVIISISGVPALILAGIVFGMRKAEEIGIKSVALILLASSIIMIAGMVIATTMVPRIDKQLVVPGIETTPYIFILAGIGMIGIVGYLFKYSRNHKSQLFKK